MQYPLYTHVHHGYGLNDAFDKSVAMLLDSSQANSEQLPPGDQVLPILMNRAQEVLII